MDVLAYAAINSQAALNKEINTKEALKATKCTEIAAINTAIQSGGPPIVNWIRCIQPQLLRCPGLTALWSCIPGLVNTPTGGFQVCAPGAEWNQGFCCQWTVPAGATVARIQLWGAGGGSGQSKCCGGSPFGSTGAYASAIIPVTAATTYTICAGCALYCCCVHVSSGQTRMSGFPSWATGPGLSNFCADGGQGSLGTWSAEYGKAAGCMRLATFACNYGGGGLNICCGSYYCTQSCQTGGEIPNVPGSMYFGDYNGSASPCCFGVWGIRGMWPRICFDTNHYGYQVHSPIYGFESVSQCCFTWTSGTCCGRAFSGCCGCLRFPGAGGWASIAMGGSYNVYGDMGKFGMACVSWF